MCAKKPLFFTALYYLWKKKKPTQIIIKARENGVITRLTENIQPVCWNSWLETWIKGLLVAKKVSAV